METLHIDGTDRTPTLLFEFDANRYLLSGESYPEDVSEFYGGLLGQLSDHLNGLQGATVQFDFNFIYFNSSTAKVVMRLFELLEQTAARGNRVTVNWHHEEGDDNMREMGGEFSEDLHQAHFNLLSKPG
ncbi:MAG: DUF1987 domain-containing protein [Magnetococcus sp. MYC-9]